MTDSSVTRLREAMAKGAEERTVTALDADWFGLQSTGPAPPTDPGTHV